MTILAGPFKRSIMARIGGLDLAAPSDLGDVVEVSATLPPEPERKCVYGGRTTWVQRDVLAERNIAFEQTVTFEVRVRVVELGDDADHAEMEAERILSLITSGVLAGPDLAGGLGRIVPTSGDADPVVAMPAPEPQVTVNLSVTFTATLSMVGA